MVAVVEFHSEVDEIRKFFLRLNEQPQYSLKSCQSHQKIDSVLQNKFFECEQKGKQL